MPKFLFTPMFLGTGDVQIIHKNTEFIEFRPVSKGEPLPKFLFTLMFFGQGHVQIIHENT